MAKSVLVSGIQPSGRLHIGNYLGALKNFVDLQNSGKYQCYFFIADLHALTENPDPKDLRKNIINLAADFLAAGLDPKKSVIFQQSQIGFLEELKWILSPLVPVSELMRMTAFKEKIMQKIEPKEGQKVSQEEFDRVVEESNMGLALYPVLMAADILIYDGQFVPVGRDQLQHLELARTIARKFNSRFGKTFVEPKAVLTKTPRVMSLKNPTKKMSKSDPASCLFLDDSPEEIKAKIARATTDSGTEISYDPAKKPGLSNLLEIYAALSHLEPKLIAEEFGGQNYAHFKMRLAELVTEYFADFRANKAKFIKNPAALKQALRLGSGQAAKVAEKKIEEVKKRIGVALD
ncbi:MAG: tryptophan--tRNA ligase [Candidatus Liptonbacteria bacterium RIFCSPLOWO2_01_FULL_52_25]|uniref:Tryptophan--tRNA ligase n=1 Tax=Candidatus Liptonbacteria bacterium RIFCSPLOWO2_01_FULL_52_25 TaxID=1798650 RepID=A0A1G2CEP8_9BACT|nr:MAG: tryptophan--tRNA ligase [Candidatus Liptonbacteria bacterium RIFCSPLOWO2_01_FULL_52_25]